MKNINIRFLKVNNIVFYVVKNRRIFINDKVYR